MGRKRIGVVKYVKIKMTVKKLPMDEKRLKVTDLNDKCLLRICKYLELAELANFAASCQRFTNVCTETFVEKYNKDNNEVQVRIYELRKNRKVDCYKNIITLFGKHIKKIRVEYDSPNDYINETIHDLIVEHCSAALVEIHFINMKRGMKINKTFPQLTKLSFSNSSLTNSNIQFEKWFPNLRRLHLELVQYIENTACIERAFPKLEYFGLVNFKTCNISIKNMIRFIKNNPQLKELRICRDNQGLLLDITYKYLSFIDLMLPNLQSLEMTYISCETPLPMLDSLPTFKNLKNLKMLCQDASTLPSMMKSVTSIEVLDLCIENGVDDSTVEYIQSCSALKSFTWYINTSDELRIMHKLSKSPLPALNRIRIFTSYGEYSFTRSLPLISVLDFIVNHRQLNEIVIGFSRTDCESNELRLFDVIESFGKVVKNKFNGKWTVSCYWQRATNKYLPLVEEAFLCVIFEKNHIG